MIYFGQHSDSERPASGDGGGRHTNPVHESTRQRPPAVTPSTAN